MSTRNLITMKKLYHNALALEAACPGVSNTSLQGWINAAIDNIENAKTCSELEEIKEFIPNNPEVAKMIDKKVQILLN